jgi:hypothetical protein
MKKRSEKFRAVLLFVWWLENQLQAPREHLFAADAAAFQRAADRFLVEQILGHGARPALANWQLLAHTRSEICHAAPLALLRYIIVAAVNDSLSALGTLAKTVLGKK